jgi:hypothetical protein
MVVKRPHEKVGCSSRVTEDEIWEGFLVVVSISLIALPSKRQLNTNMNLTVKTCCRFAGLVVSLLEN